MYPLLNQFLSNLNLLADEVEELGHDLDVRDFPKGTILLEQGAVSDDCYFVLKGCVRQYTIDEDGKGQTVNFITEYDTAMIYRSYTLRIPSDYSLAYIEDSVLLIADFFSESAMFEKYPTLVNITHSFM